VFQPGRGAEHPVVGEYRQRRALSGAVASARIRVGYGAGESVPVTEQIADRILSLPLCAELFENEQDRIVGEFLRVARP
jgi:dTDP-4-amino-4,6-dideoxygalactose transaminase